MDKERQMIVDKLVSKEAKAWIRKSPKLYCRKNSEKAGLLRAKGNALFAEMPKSFLKMEEIHKVYSQSIALAECNSEELAFGYSNRSAILLRMHKYEECIIDIDTALKLNDSKLLHAKLLCRRVECLINLGLLLQSLNEFAKAESLVAAMKDGDANKKSLEKTIEKIRHMHLVCPESENKKNQKTPEHIQLLNKKEKENFFDSLSIGWNEKYGRHIVANRDFKPGEILFVEKPYMQVPNLKNFHKVCGHCLAECWATVPCNYCRWCMFCSEDCKKKSWKSYHEIECIVIDQIIKRKAFDHFDLLTIRALALGIKEAGSIQNLKEELERIDACTDKCAKGFLKNGSLQNLGFQSMYTLNDTTIDLIKLPECTTKSVRHLIILIKYTSLFGENIECNLENLLINDEVLFIGSLLLKLFKIMEGNGAILPHEGSCKYSDDNVMCKVNKCCTPGFYVAIFRSLFNHDCYLQVINTMEKTKNRLIAASVRPIKKNSQIFFNYGANFFDMPKDARQMYLKELYNFTCTCTACKENWPSLTEQNVLLKKNPEAYLPDVDVKYISMELNSVKEADPSLDGIKVISDIICKRYEDSRYSSFHLWRLEICMYNILGAVYDFYTIE